MKTLQFGSTMPKLLLVGLVERVCVKTVVREIPGITDCFKNEEDGKNGDKLFSVGPHHHAVIERASLIPSAAGDERIEHPRALAIRLWQWR